MREHVRHGRDEPREPGGLHLRETGVVHLEDERHVAFPDLRGHREKALVVGLERGDVERDQRVAVAVRLEADGGHAQRSKGGFGFRAVEILDAVRPKGTGEQNAARARRSREERPAHAG